MFDPIFATLAQRGAFREYLQGLLLRRNRNKTLTAVVGAEPIFQTQRAATRRLQSFSSESTWDAAAVSARRLELLLTDPATGLHEDRGLVVDEIGDRKDNTEAAHIARGYLGSIGKVDNGIVAVAWQCHICLGWRI